jgi:ATP synthase protein I
VNDDLRRVVFGQLLVALLAGAAIVVIQGWTAGLGSALSALYGGGVALANTLLLMWRRGRSTRRKPADAQRQLRMFYLSSVERFLAVATLLVAGMTALGLSPLPMVAGFVLGQLTLLIAGFMGGIT